jgi:4-hydroxy-2-oxoheptanedioate aldolase
VSYQIAGSESATAGVSLRQIVEERRVAYGGWCMLPSSLATEVVSASGCDWICLDLQHGLIGDEAMRTMVQAAAIRAMPVAVRVPWNEPASIMRALDAGAEGVIVPMVNTAAQAEQAVAATRYPPLGYRSWGPLRSLMADAAFNPARGNELSVCIVMVETVEAFGNLEAILAVPGVDAVLVGPSDLSISHAGDNSGAASSERDVAMIEEVAAACARRGVVASISCGSGEEARRWRAVGYTLLALPSDAALIGAGMAATLAEARDGGGHA